MSSFNSSRFCVLHAIRVKGLASSEVITMLAGLTPNDVARELAALAQDNLVQYRQGRLTGYMLTPAGQQVHISLLAVNVQAPSTQAALNKAYEEFLLLNGEFKQICTNWQVQESTGMPNDHSNDAYDRVILERLADTHKRIEEIVLTPLTAVLDRFGLYVPRLVGALERIRSGDTAAFARPMANSYHDIWMELHQDLLLSLQRKRSARDEA